MEVKLRDGEGASQLIRRFMRKVKDARIIEEHLEAVTFYRSPAERKRLKRKRARTRRRRNARRVR